MSSVPSPIVVKPPTAEIPEPNPFALESVALPASIPEPIKVQKPAVVMLSPQAVPTTVL